MGGLFLIFAGFGLTANDMPMTGWWVMCAGAIFLLKTAMNE
jgi:hypothetical protein